MKAQTLQLPDLTRAASSLLAMQRGTLVLPAKTESATVMKLKARIRELEAADARRIETETIKAHRLAFMESKTAHVRDNTKAFTAPEVIATTDAVHLRLPLNPRTAIPMALPALSVLRNWLFKRR